MVVVVVVAAVVVVVVAVAIAVAVAAAVAVAVAVAVVVVVVVVEVVVVLVATRLPPLVLLLQALIPHVRHCWPCFSLYCPSCSIDPLRSLSGSSLSAVPSPRCHAATRSFISVYLPPDCPNSRGKAVEGLMLPSERLSHTSAR